MADEIIEGSVELTSKKRNPKNRLFYQHPDDKDKRIFMFEESNHRWGTLRNYVKGNTQNPASRFLLATGINGGNWEKGKYSKSIYDKSMILPHLIFDIEKDRIYKIKCRLVDFKEVL